MHVAGKRQHAHEDAQRQRIPPPGQDHVVRIRQELPEHPVQRKGQEAAAGDMGDEALAKEPQREDGPERIEADAVQQARARGPAHAEKQRCDALDHGKADADQHQQQEKVHQERQHGAGNRRLGLLHEEIEENRVVEGMDPGRNEGEHLDMPYDNQHEPAEGDGGMHEAEQRLALPQLHVNQAVQEDVADVLPDGLRGDERDEKALAVAFRQLVDDPDHADEAIAQHERHAEEERNDEVFKLSDLPHCAASF